MPKFFAPLPCLLASTLVFAVPALAGPDCPQDADCDGISNDIEAAVGGAGIDPVPGSSVVSGNLGPDGTIQIDLASPGLAGTGSVMLPGGTTAGALPITLEYALDTSNQPFIVVGRATIPAGRTKSITMPAGSSSIVAIADFPGASGNSLRSTPKSRRFHLPPCPCPSTTSTNLEGEATVYTVTNQGGGTLNVSGLLHSAVGMTESETPLPATSPLSIAALLAAMMTAGLLAMRKVERRVG